jgi:hypothetical protein
MDSQPNHRAALEAALLELDGAWTLLAGVRLGGTAADYLLLHPQHGAALVDLAPGRHGGARALRAFLEEQDFARFFAGTVPVVHLTLERGAECELRRRLGVAFAASEPATIANPEWAQALAALIAAEQSRGAWLGAPTPAVDSAQSDASEAHFAAEGPPDAAAAPDTEERGDDATADDAAPARENLRDLAPHMPRWQTVAAFASLAAFGMLYLALPGETPRAPPAAVEVAIAPAAPHGGSGSSVPPATQSPGPGALPPAPPHAAAETPVTIAAMPPPPAALPPPEAPPPVPHLAQPPVDAASVPLPEVAETAPPAKVAATEPRPGETKDATGQKAQPHAPPRVTEAHVPADELAVNALPPPPPPRPAPPSAAAPLVDARAAGLQAEPAARPVQPVSDLIHRNCRVYSSRVTVLGAPAEVRGFACQAADGSWEIMSEAPAAAH